jgi:hypothetical protein
MGGAEMAGHPRFQKAKPGMSGNDVFVLAIMRVLNTYKGIYLDWPRLQKNLSVWDAL